LLVIAMGLLIGGAGRLLVAGSAPPARGLPAGNLRRTSQEGSIAVPLR